MCIQYCSKSLLTIDFMSLRLLPFKGERAEVPAREARLVLLFLDEITPKFVVRTEF